LGGELIILVSTLFRVLLNYFKEALSTAVLCALLFLFFPRIQFIARPIVGRPAFASQAVFFDKAGASASEILM